ncbi:hypothetical protein OG21DRAFT_145671 [Imleria badia]|nr:hypothetical protein OG21DRAFT_145671 [Imleria badia]
MRLHLPTPGPCSSCVDSGHADAWKACYGRHRRKFEFCPSNTALSKIDHNFAYCPECITEHKGQHCACGSVWLCDCCLKVPVYSDPRYPALISCRRCGGAYCREDNGCRYCCFCQVCCQAGICFGCQALEKGNIEGEDVSGEGSQPLNVYERCRQCGLSICMECRSMGKDGVVQCSGCQHWMCGRCARGKTQCRSTDVRRGAYSVCEELVVWRYMFKLHCVRYRLYILCSRY